jgi:predicted phosphodiesterase
MVQYHLAVLADIHGNLPAFEAVMLDLESRSPLDAILVVGDIVGGPGQQTILQRLIDRDAVMVQGNGEQGIARLASGTAPGYISAAHQFSLMRWVYEHLSPEQVSYLRDVVWDRAENTFPWVELRRHLQL